MKLSLCSYVFSSLIPTSSRLNSNFSGLWRLDFNLVASHAICCAVLVDKTAKSIAIKLIEHRRRESASSLSQTPSRLNKNPTAKPNEQNKSSIDEDLIIDRIFFDPFCDGDKFVVENITRKRDEDFWDGPTLISVAKDGGMDDFGKIICTDPSTKDNEMTEEASYRCAANSSVAYLQLGEFILFTNEHISIQNYRHSYTLLN